MGKLPRIVSFYVFTYSLQVQDKQPDLQHNGITSSETEMRMWKLVVLIKITRKLLSLKMKISTTLKREITRQCLLQKLSEN